MKFWDSVLFVLGLMLLGVSVYGVFYIHPIFFIPMICGSVLSAFILIINSEDNTSKLPVQNKGNVE